MAESALSLNYDQLRSKIGDFLGYGRLSWTTAEKVNTNWSNDQEEDIEECIDNGLREFYAPPRLPGMGAAHEWSFLRPVRRLVRTQANIFEYELPDDVAGLEGQLTVQTTTSGYYPIKLMSTDFIRECRTREGAVATGAPVIAGTAYKDGTPQRLTLMLYPTPDAVYSIEGRCFLNPRKLSKDNPYPYGGMHHTQTVLEACLAAAERQKGDMDGHHRQAFYERLAASIQIDKNQRGTHLGYNSDPSTPEEAIFMGGQTFATGIATINGQSY